MAKVNEDETAKGDADVSTNGFTSKQFTPHT